MEVTYSLTTGWPSQVESTLRRRISGYTRGVEFFKIGITSNPDDRAKRYEYDEPYDEMIVIYSTKSRDHVTRLEAWLVAYYEDYCDNLVGGGGGGRRGSPPYYLYIVRDR